MAVRPLIEQTIERFQEKVACDPSMQKELEGVTKRVNIDLCSETYHFVLDNKRICGFDTGLLDCPDIMIKSDPQTVEDLFTGKMKPMKAWALKKIVIKGSLEDIMRLRKFF
ncbi:MAG TPA: SCP2 sterol-binding domain-containing protein [Methanomassiliicoccales archaeon]|nr:SCP2 sterol-binding domain-containing protein [Methanomassiliicoccales archaeon]